MENRNIYEGIAKRTGGDIYIGVVGPVRTGKSTFIKQFMETMVLPRIDNPYRRERAKDELPQSASGKTIMTAEPKFVPEEAVELTMEGGAAFKVRMIDCVGYMVHGALGSLEGDAPRMVHTPWSEKEVPMSEAAELGTRMVIAEHSTIGLVVTTDGSITEIPREDYVEPEGRVIRELQEIRKPFLVLVNSTDPEGERAQSVRKNLEERWGVTAMAVNCMKLTGDKIAEILRAVLYEFPVREIAVRLPAWVNSLPAKHPLKEEIYAAVRSMGEQADRLKRLRGAAEALSESPSITAGRLDEMSPGDGTAIVSVVVPQSLFYDIVSKQTGFAVQNDGALLTLLCGLADMKREYDRFAGALERVRQTGYGIVMPTLEELRLEEPEMVKQGGQYGVRLKASAPSIHMIRADIETEVSPTVGSEKQSEELVHYLLSEFDGEPGRIWESNIFGKSLSELVNEGLNNKLNRMPEDARMKLQETLQRIINEGSGGLICIIL